MTPARLASSMEIPILVGSYNRDVSFMLKSPKVPVQVPYLPRLLRITTATLPFSQRQLKTGFGVEVAVFPVATRR